MVIKGSLTKGLFREVWHCYKSQQGTWGTGERFPPAGLEGQKVGMAWHEPGIGGVEETPPAAASRKLGDGRLGNKFTSPFLRP